VTVSFPTHTHCACSGGMVLDWGTGSWC